MINGLGYVGIGDGAKELPANLLAPDEDFTAAIPLPQGHVILADGDYLLGEQGIGVFDSHMNPVSYTHLDVYKRQGILYQDVFGKHTGIHRNGQEVPAWMYRRDLSVFWSVYI